jgi:Stress responsive A/B Barrel Domain
MATRRKFITSTATMALAATVPSLSNAQNEKKTLVHHVYFWLKNPASKEDLSKLIEGLQTLKKIGTLRMAKIGIPASTEKRDVVDNSYSISWLTTFNSIKDQEVYQNHPIHLKFVETYSPLWNKVVVYDSMDI